MMAQKRTILSCRPLSRTMRTKREECKTRIEAKEGSKPLNVLAAAFGHAESKH